MELTIPQRGVRLAGGYPTRELDRLLADLGPLWGLAEPAIVRIDLQLLESISAPSVAVFVAAVLEASARGLLATGSQIGLPTDTAVRARLEQLGVLGLLTDWSPDTQPDQQPARGWRPCQLFDPTEDPTDAAWELSAVVSEACHTETLARHAIFYALNEIAKNVVDHAGATSGAVGIAEMASGALEIEVAIADFGVGVHSSLTTNPKHEQITEIEALRVAVSAGGTSRVDPPGEAGLGLFLTKVILGDNGGQLAVRSGGAELVIGSATSERSALEHMYGTLVILRFRTDRPVRLEGIVPA